jgi:hypothetical protein
MWVNSTRTVVTKPNPSIGSECDVQTSYVSASSSGIQPLAYRYFSMVPVRVDFGTAPMTVSSF